MVRGVRIKSYIFSIGSLTADAGGQIDSYSEYPLNGTLQKVVWDAGNHTATGSLYFSISGAVQEPILTLISGTNGGNAGSDFVKYPISEVTSPVNGTFLGLEGGDHTQFVMNSLFRTQSSGLGNGTSGLGLTVYYI